MIPWLGSLLLVAAGGALGGIARFGLTRFVDFRTQGTFPWGTLCVNASGALLIGLLAGTLSVSTGMLPASAWLFLAIGVLGSYTTVSSFSLQTLALLRRGERSAATLNVVLSLTLCLGLAAGAYFLGHSLASG